MHEDTTRLPFLGPCGVCGKINHNYTQLSLHLGGGRSNRRPDAAHLDLKKRWHAWRGNHYYRKSHCVKCGELFEVHDKKDCRKRRCDRCIHLSQTMGARAYAALDFDRPRSMPHAKKTPYRFPDHYKASVRWEPGCLLYLKVAQALLDGHGLYAIRDRLGVPLNVAQEIIIDLLGDGGYAAWWLETKRKTIARNALQAQRSSKLEQAFVDQLQDIGIEPCARNSWATIAVGGRKVHREADIKVAVGDGRKVLVLCDGVAFHGPGCIYADPEVKAADDRATALAFYEMGYTVLRYSGDEIRDGSALVHFQGVMDDLTMYQRVYRNWYPREEMHCGTTRAGTSRPC